MEIGLAWLVGVGQMQETLLDLSRLDTTGTDLTGCGRGVSTNPEETLALNELVW
jgi:hypothetical protein